MSFSAVTCQALPLPGSLDSRLRCSLQAQGFSTAELRCGLFGSDLELLDANECPENLGCSRGAVLTADAANELATIDLQLDDMPISLGHLVLATVGKTSAQGGCLSLSIATGQFHHEFRRSHSPDHGRGMYTQGCMLAVLSRRSQGWLLQEVVPNIGLSCEQQEDAIVRELYWPEVGVAIERTVTTEDGPSITWLEVFRAYPDGTYPSDDDSETASHASPLGSNQPELVTSFLSPGNSDLEKASLASAPSDRPSHMWNKKCQSYPAHHTRQTPSSLFRNGGQDFLPFEQLKDFGPPRAAGKGLMGSESQVAELCQEAGKLSVSLKLSEDRLSKSESLVAHLRSETAQLREDNLSFTEEASRKEAKILRLRSELDHCMSELQQRTQSMRAQHAELEAISKLRAKELTKQERCKGEVAALQKELTRVNQQLLEEKREWEQEKESIRLSLQERTAEAKAARLAEHSRNNDLDKLQQELFLERAEAARCRTELLDERKVKEEPTGSQRRASFGDVKVGNKLVVEMLQAELSKLQSSFAEELGTARARLAVAEKRNKDLLENLQSTVRAANCVRAVDRPASLPDPPSVLPLSGDRKSGPVMFGHQGLKPEDRASESMTTQLSVQGRQGHEKPVYGFANSSRSEHGHRVWELNSQHRDRTEQQARHQQELQWQQLRPSSGSASSETGKLETDSAGVSHSPIRSRDFGRLPSAPSFASSSSSSLGDTLRRAVAERRRSREHKATCALDDEYTRFVKEGSGKGFRQISSREVMNIREARQAPREPFVLSDLGSA